MPRLRRYRVFLVFALVVVALLYHVSNSQPERLQTLKFEPSKPGHDKPPTQKPLHKQPPSQRPPKNKSPPGTPPRPGPPAATPAATAATVVAPNKKEPTVKIPQLKSSDEVKGAYGLPTPAPNPTEVEKAAPPTTTAAVPDIKPGSGHHENLGDDEGARYADWPLLATTATSTVHWRKPYEFYPVPEESLIMLPTGKPKAIPAVQYAFGEETDTAKEKRELRLAKVKAEAKRAWDGYKQYAWTHDEVQPVSKQPHDPFCGWAATLVDALDTLWIMGMRDEFDDAVKAVKAIDFTTTPYRNDIPVFETIIRYLGGLVGAYDVTGGHDGTYRVLLDKAEELADILMGVFDTPNRMPILYYQWKPQYNENPKRASPSSGVAEMGSMSMEFTRLAQLTGKNKYYDAIARITDALEEFQNRPGGTALPGIFPQNIDASGCNKTAADERRVKAASDAAKKQAAEAAKDLTEEPQGYTPGAAKIKTDSDGDGKQDLAFEAGSIANPITLAAGGVSKRSVNNADVDAEAVGPPYTAFGVTEDPDCVPQNLTSGGYGTDSYSMGGSQDSAYEYFPKQYVLLGGLVPKYQTMHVKTVEAVKKYLLFRPRVEDDPDILFSAKATTHMGSALTYEYEITHLTCFLGGMFALGGRIFERREDVEIGKRLAAGCAWAYDVMPTGIMPEYAVVMACEDASNCHFDNQTWHETLDPEMASRGRRMEEYHVRLAEWKTEVAELKKKKAQQEAEATRKAGEEKQRMAGEAKRKLDEEARKEAEVGEERRLRPVNDTLPGGKDSGESSRDPKEKKARAKRDISDPGDLPSGDAAAAKATEDKVKKVEGKLDFNAEVKQPQEATEEKEKAPTTHYVTPLKHSTEDAAQKPIVEEIVFPEEPVKPVTHQEYITRYLGNVYLAPGFVSLNDRRYILRPEAIESVWYMYRITGDPVWQERGWRMFEAVIRATKTDVGHSAIWDVTTSRDKKPDTTDSMESFWLAETLKYFYLLFAEPDVISLDDWVLNTEAHPFRRPK